MHVTPIQPVLTPTPKPPEPGHHHGEPLGLKVHSVIAAEDSYAVPYYVERLRKNHARRQKEYFASFLLVTITNTHRTSDEKPYILFQLWLSQD